jgi:hypothetical protein
MKNDTVTFEQLRDVLLALGYVADPPNAKYMIFRHPDSYLFVILPKLRCRDIVAPMNLLSVRSTLANSGMVAKDEFDSLFRTPMGSIALWHRIIDAEAKYHNQHGHPPHVLELPVLQAYDLAKLRPSEFGPLAEQVMRDGIKVFEEQGLLGIPVRLVQGTGEFVFE